MDTPRKAARRVPGQVCIYCNERPATTDDHVPPASWYSDNLPKLQRVTVPCCEPCNTRFAKAEQEFLLPLAMSIGDSSPLFRDVAARFMRSFQGAAGAKKGNVRARVARARAMQSMIQFVPWVPGAPRAKVLTPAGLLVTMAPTFVLKHEPRKVVGEKLARGLLWHSTGRTLPSTTVFQAGLGEHMRRHTPEVLPHLAAVPTDGRLAPVLVWKFVEQGEGRMWLFLLWERVELLVMTRPDVPAKD